MFNLSIDSNGTIIADQTNLVTEKTLRECLIDLYETTSIIILETDLSFKEKVEIFFRNLITSITGFFKRIISTILEPDNRDYIKVKANKKYILGFNGKHIITIERENLFTPRGNFNADFVIAECENMATNITSSMFNDPKQLDVDKIKEKLEKRITGGKTFEEIERTSDYSDNLNYGLLEYFYGKKSTATINDTVSNQQIYDSYIKAYENFSKIRKMQDKLMIFLNKVKNEILVRGKKDVSVVSNPLVIVNKTVTAILQVLSTCVKIFKYQLRALYIIIERMISSYV